ncbi:aldehyde dehydrogenase, mitochondrial [Dermatophagoides pteronyssinus]|uniref:aldehyde dehydrogenase, mitochondrial n=1 Tax=Dermatophagoides pteronyssinus TaxID=6956 RepID=UPI003F66ABF6
MENVEVKYTQIFINNEWHDSLDGKTFETINPFNEEKIADIQAGNKADVDRAVSAAVDAFRLDSKWRQMDASQRGELLYRLADLIQRDQDYIASLESLDNGKPKMLALMDVDMSIKTIRYYAGYADKIHGKTIPADGKLFAYTRIEPVGVCGQIIPWNFPFLMACWKFGPALCAGNTVVLKPAEQTPLSALYLASLTKEVGFPPGVINVVPGFGETAGAALVDHPKVDKIAFTGSTEIGKLIMRNGSHSMKRITLELGGKSPLVVTGNVEDIAKAARTAQDSCFLNMGQCCCAGTRTFVHESIYDEFVKHSAEYCQSYVLGNPFEPTTQFGPQVDETQMNRILEMIESGKQDGARCVAGGNRPDRRGYFIQPTVFADVTDGMRIAREEIFGPVQQILKYKTLDEVIERCNDTNYGLGSGILTNDINEAMKFSRSIRAGSVWINTPYMLPVSAQTPFGGFKESGIGRELGEDGLRGYGEIKTVVIMDCDKKV